MVVDESAVFNLWDTNGRRGDVVNALHQYLNILINNEDVIKQGWGVFPNSLGQFSFYKAAIEASPDVLEVHPQYDYLVSKYSSEISSFLKNDKKPLQEALTKEDRRILDTYVESRARHYMNCLKKLGFASADGKVTEAGRAFLKGSISRDGIEDSLPLNDSNIILLRQLLKLRVYSKENGEGHRTFFAPFKLALLTLLTKGKTEANVFLPFIQCGSPYRPFDPIQGIHAFFDDKILDSFMAESDKVNLRSEHLSRIEFSHYFWNRKSSVTSDKYYDFYSLLYTFCDKRDEESFEALMSFLFDPKFKTKIEKAFGYGGPLFNYGDAGSSITLEFFIELNAKNDLLNCSTNINNALYARFEKSKFLDTMYEYADTTKRMFDACGLIGFDKGIASLSFDGLIEAIIDVDELKNQVFGESTRADFEEYELGTPVNDSIMGSDLSLGTILCYDSIKVGQKVAGIEAKYGANIETVKEIVRKKTNEDFIHHIEEKYPVEKVLELLKLFPGRAHDKTIKSYVNKEATVPTIYEYLSAIAWYYISEKDYNLYDSLNLTLNADFEPVLHAQGGDGDIVIKESNRVVMLEVTLMDQASQGRGELEPVQRHSTNLKAKYKDKGIETITFFISSELSENTVNIWRGLFSMELMATFATISVNNVLIMSFTDSEICEFLEKNISANQIIEKTKTEFETKPISGSWRSNLVQSILSGN